MRRSAKVLYSVQFLNLRCHLKKKTVFPKLLNLKKPKRWEASKLQAKIDQHFLESDAMYLEKTAVNILLGVRAGRSEVRIPGIIASPKWPDGLWRPPSLLAIATGA